MAKKYYDENGREVVIKKRGGCLKNILIMIGVLVIVGFIGNYFSGSDNTSTTNNSQNNVADVKPTENNKEEILEEEPIIEVSATQLLEDYDANEVRANEQYKGKRAKISGIVDSIGETFGQTYVTINGGDEFELLSVQCFFKDSSALSSLNKGDQITVEGNIDGKSMNIGVKDCTLIQ